MNGVRCENCEHFNRSFCRNKNGFTNGGFVFETDFCSRWSPRKITGAWKEVGENKYECSVCGMVVEGNEEDLNLCPKCGATIEEVFWR